MRVPIGWLREFVDVPADANAIADRLAMLGFPVDEIERRPPITGVVVGKILHLEKHPNADRLQVARVDVARDKPLTIATAATNVAAGQTIAVATIGARLPHLTIEPRTMRGVESEGMMISAEELALPSEWFEDGIMQLDAGIALGADVVELFGLDGDVLDVEITSNRVDAMSIVGLARELAASYGSPLRLPPFQNPGDGADAPRDTPHVTIESGDCRRLVAQRFDRIRVGPSPPKMRIRLALAGQRPINNVVDVSNYVMIETGQPLHFYDAARVHDMHLIVRDGRDGESIVTLDDVRRPLGPFALVIADSREPLGLAGLMGGKSSAVSDVTTAVLLESANFNGARIRRGAMAFGLRSDAGARHEKTLAPALTDIGAARAAQLLCALGAKAYAPHAYGSDLAEPETIALRIADVERLLGLAVSADRVGAHLRALGCTVVASDEDALAVTAPPWRRDLAIAADLIEEVARMEGYDRIEPVVPSVPSHDVSSVAFDRENAIATALATLGYREIVTHSLHGQDPLDRFLQAGIETKQPVEVRNPLSEDQRYLRSSLDAGVLSYFASVAAPVRVFEIGRVFARDGDGVAETPKLILGFCADPIDEPPWRDRRFLEFKGDCEALFAIVTGRRTDAERGAYDGLHPGKTATLSIDGRAVGWIGRVDPRLAKAFDVRLPAYLCSVDVDALPEFSLPRYRPPSKLPGTSRDLALVVDLNVAAADIERTVLDTLGTSCTGVRVFDEYRGPQVGERQKSLAVRIGLARFDATITDEEADDAVARVLPVLADRLGAAIRR